MSSKNEFDFVDFWQKHNRNAQLKRSADAAVDAARARKEQARQARLDREANDRHRAEMEEMAKKEKEANDRHRAEMKEMARKEKEAKEFTKQQQFKLYDISCQVKELRKLDTVLSRIRLFYEINAEFEKIVHDAIVDLKYRKLYTQVESALNNEKNIIIQKYQGELSLYHTYCELKQKADKFDNDCIIATFEELHEAEKTLEEINNLSAETPELAIDTQKLQSSIEYFVVGTAKLKWFLELLDSNMIAPTEQRRTLLFSYYGVNEQITLSEEWGRISPVELSADDIGPFCDYAFEYLVRDPSFTDTVLEIIGNIDDPIAEQTVVKIKEEQQRRIAEEKAQKKEEKQYKQLVKQLAVQEDKMNQKEVENTTLCMICLGIMVIIPGGVIVMKGAILFGCVIIAIGLFLIRVACNYYSSKKQNKQ